MVRNVRIICRSDHVVVTSIDLLIQNSSYFSAALRFRQNQDREQNDSKKRRRTLEFDLPEHDGGLVELFLRIAESRGGAVTVFRPPLAETCVAAYIMRLAMELGANSAWYKKMHRAFKGPSVAYLNFICSGLDAGYSEARHKLLELYTQFEYQYNHTGETRDDAELDLIRMGFSLLLAPDDDRLAEFLRRFRDVVGLGNWTRDGTLITDLGQLIERMAATQYRQDDLVHFTVNLDFAAATATNVGACGIHAIRPSSEEWLEMLSMEPNLARGGDSAIRCIFRAAWNSVDMTSSDTFDLVERAALAFNHEDPTALPTFLSDWMNGGPECQSFLHAAVLHGSDELSRSLARKVPCQLLLKALKAHGFPATPTSQAVIERLMQDGEDVKEVDETYLVYAMLNSRDGRPWARILLRRKVSIKSGTPGILDVAPEAISQLFSPGLSPEDGQLVRGMLQMYTNVRIWAIQALSIAATKLTGKEVDVIVDVVSPLSDKERSILMDRIQYDVDVYHGSTWPQPRLPIPGHCMTGHG